MVISFSGLGSGIDTTSWVKSLTQLRQAKVVKLEEEKQTVAVAQTTLQSIRSIFASFRASLEKITDSKFNVSNMDIFSKKIAAVSNAAILSATAKSNAAEGSYEVKVKNIATQTKVKSGYRYKTTVISTTQATTTSSLKNIGIGYGTNPESGVTAGDIEIDHNDVTSRISISEDETMSSFLGKLHDAGINAEFDNATGIFSIDVNVGDIRDIGNTNILNKLKISDINYGYTGEQLKIEETHEEYHQAELTTLLSDLGVNVGTIAISTANGDYEVTLDENDTIGSLVSALRSGGIEATFSEGIFSITNANITNDGTTGLIEHFGLTTPDIASQTQLSNGLTYQTVYSETTTASLSSFLKDIDGVTLEGEQTINVKDAEGNLSTITVGTTTTVGDMVNGMNNAGMTVSYNEASGVLSIEDGWIVSGGSFDVESAFGLQYTGVSATVTGSVLTVTTTTISGATSSTQLKDLSTAVTSGTIKVTDTTDTIHNLVIDENSTIGELVSQIRGLGLGADFDNTTGVLTLTGGSYTTDGIPEGNASNFLNVFFGSDTLSPNAIDSAVSTSQSLRENIITTHAAEGTTTLNQLGMNEGTYTATFTSGLTEAEIEINGNTTMSELVSALRSAGIDASFDSANSKLILTDAAFAGVTGGNFDTAMNFTETTTGRYVTSDGVTSQTVTIGKEMTSAGIVQYTIYSTATISTTVSVTSPIETTSGVLSYQSVTTTQTAGTEGIDIIGTELTVSDYTSVPTVQTTGTLTYDSITPATTTTVGQTVTGSVIYTNVYSPVEQTSSLELTQVNTVPGSTTTVGQTVTGSTIYTDSTTGVAQTVSLTYTSVNTVPATTTTVGQTLTSSPVYTDVTTGVQQTSTLQYVADTPTTVGQTLTGTTMYTQGGVETAASSTTLAELGMTGENGIIVTDIGTVTVSSTDTLGCLMGKLYAAGQKEESYTVSANAGTIGGVLLEDLAAANNGFIAEVDIDTPEIIVVNAEDLADAIANYTTIGIGSSEALAQLATLVNSRTNCSGKTIVLTTDLDLTSICAANTDGEGIGGWTPIGTYYGVGMFPGFSGTFNGNGHKISGLYYNNPEGSGALFDHAEHATIKNLCVENVNITGDNVSGLISGACACVTISNCYTSGELYAINNGFGVATGLAVGATASSMEITNCYSSCDITSEISGAGLLYNMSSLGLSDSITNCYYSGNISAAYYAYGLVEGSASTTVTNSYSTGNIYVSEDTDEGVDGIGLVTSIDCFATGALSYGERLFTSSIENGSLTITPEGEHYLKSMSANLEVVLGINTGYEESYTAGYNTITASATTTMAELGLSQDGTIFNNSGDAVTIQTTDTVDSVVSKINSLGVSASFADGTLTVGTDSSSRYITSVSSRVAQVLGIDAGEGNSYSVENGVSAQASMSLAQLGMTGENGIIVTDTGTITVSSTDTLGCLMGKLYSVGQKEESYTVSANAGTIDGVLLEDLAAANNGFIAEVDIDTPEITVVNAEDLADAIANYTTIGIGSSEALAQLATLVNSRTNCSGKTIVLTTDLDLTSICAANTDSEGIGGWTPIGTYYSAGLFPGFSGTFNGNGHKISGLYYNNPEGYGALFDHAEHATIKNLCVENVNITGDSASGIISGACARVTISNCYTSGELYAIDNGFGVATGLAIGDSTSAMEITNCYSSCDITSEISGAGLLYNSSTIGLSDSITNCYYSGNISAAYYACGLVEGFASTTVTNSYTTGNIYVSEDTDEGVYGIGLVTSIDCFATGALSYGERLFTSSIENGSLTITPEGEHYIKSMSANLEVLFGMNTGYEESYGVNITDTEITTETVTATSATTMAQLGLAHDGYIVNNLGNTVTIQTTDTINTLCTKLSSLSITSSFTNGTLTVGSNSSGNYITNVSAGLASVLGIDEGEGISYQVDSGVTATADMTLAQLGMSGSSGVIVTNNQTVTVLATQTIGDLIDEFAPQLPDWTDDIVASAGTTNGSVSLEYATNARDHLGFIDSITTIRPEVTVRAGELETVLSRGNASIIGIGDAATLGELAELVNSGSYDCSRITIVLTDDIDLSRVNSWTPIGTGYDSSRKYNPFCGTFDGNGHTISNLSIDTTGDREASDYQGLFGYTENAAIRNLGVTNVSIISENGTSAGGIVGSLNGGDITNCYVIGSIEGSDNTGELAGDVKNATISNCYTSGTVEGSDNTGGLIGIADSTFLGFCYSLSDVAGDNNAGGLIGKYTATHGDHTFRNNYAKGDVTGGNCTGGFIGLNDYTGLEILYCYATGDVTGDDYTGGFIGWSKGDISDSYSTGNVSGSSMVGGFAGALAPVSSTGSRTYDDIFSTGTVSGDNEVGSLVGRINSTSDGSNYQIINIGNTTAKPQGLDLIGFEGGFGNTSYNSGQMNDWLAGYTQMHSDISISLANGQVTITPDNGYLKSMSANLELVLGVNTGYEESYGVNITETETVTETVAATGTALMSELGLNQDGTIINSAGNTVTIQTTDTLDSVVTKINSLGVSASFVDGTLTIGNESDSNYITNMSSGIAAALSIDAGDGYSYLTEHGVTADSSMTLAQLGMSGSSGVITTDSSTITVSSSSTLQDVIDALDDANIAASLTQGVITITPDDGHYLRSVTSNLETILGINSGYNESYGINVDESTTSTITATAATTFAQLGLTENGEIVTHSGNTVTVHSTDTIGNLQSVLSDNSVETNFASGVLNVLSSGADYIESMSENLQNLFGFENSYSINGTVQTAATTDTALTTLGMSENSTGYITANTGTITVSSSSTIQDVIDQLNAAGFSASFTDSKISISPDENLYITSISAGLSDALGLQAGYGTSFQNTPEITETTSVTATTATTLSTLGLVSDGTIVTNAGNITITSSMSISDVLDELSSNSITASFSDGVLSLGDDGDTNYIKSMSSNLISVFGNISVGEDFSYSVGEDVETSTSVTSSLTSITLSSTFGDIGITQESVLNLSDGETVTVNSATTFSNFIGDMSDKGINVSLVNGIFNIESGEPYITGYTGNNILNSMNIVGSTYQVTDLNLGNTKLKDLKDSLGNSLGITSGAVTAYKNGIANNIYIDNNSTLDELASQLNNYNIQMLYGNGSNGRIYFTSTGDSYLSTSPEGSNLLSALNIETWTEVKDTESNTLQYTTGNDIVINNDTKLINLKDTSGNSLGITAGKYKIVAAGINYEGTITASTSVNDFFTDIARYGFTGSINSDGQITVNTTNDDTYLVNSNGAEGYSNIVDTVFSSWTFGNIYTSGAMDVTETESNYIIRDTRLYDIDPAYHGGRISVLDYQGNFVGLITVNNSTTVGDFMDEISMYGFTSSISNGVLQIRNDGYRTLQSAGACNALNMLGINTSAWEEPGYYTGSAQNATTYNTVLEAATRSTTLANLRNAEGNELGITTGDYIIHSNGISHTVTLSSTDITLDSFMNTLENYGINTIFDTSDGQSVLKIVGGGDSYVESLTGGGASNVIEKLFSDGAPSTLYNYSGYQQTTELVSTTVVATLGTSVSDYGNSEGIVALTVNGRYSEINVTSYETFGSLLEKFERAGVQASLTDGVMRLETGNRNFTIDTEHTTSHLLDNLGLHFSDNLGGFAASSDSVTQTTTAIEDRTLSVAKYADYETQLSLLNISSGTFSVYRNGEKKLISIDNTETFDDFRTKLQTAFADIDIDFANGKLRFFSTSEGVDVQVGSSNDTSNIASVCGFSQDENGNIISARELYKVNASSKITTSDLFRLGNVTEGTFIIGDATFNITENTTIQNIISQINSSEQANASAYWDSVDGKLVISARNTGASIVNIEAGTSNFTDILGLTASEWNPDGSINTTRIKLDSQELGGNAKFSINGTNFQSASNVITSDISRIQGLTLNLKSASAGDSVIVNVSQDSEAVTEAVGQFVESYNELIENVNNELSANGALKDQNSLKYIKQQIRDLLTSSFAGATTFRNLSAIGISTSTGNSSLAADTSASAIEYLYFDSEKFMEGYNKDAEAVKSMLVGSDESQGILLQVQNIVTNALSSGSGYFAAADKSYSDKITSLNEKIKKANLAIEAYRARLEKQFQSMDMLISQMQNQYNSFLSQGVTNTSTSTATKLW